MANVEMLKSAIGKSLPGKPNNNMGGFLDQEAKLNQGPAKMPTPPALPGALGSKPVKMPTPKAPAITSPYAKPLMQSPSGATNPGTYFQRPKPFAPEAKPAEPNNKLGNLRTLGKATGQIGPKTLPGVKTDILKDKITSAAKKTSPSSPNGKKPLGNNASFSQ